MRLVATNKWSAETARLAERAGYCCEYCGLDLLGSAENYKQFEIDHIVPRRCGGKDESENQAIACRWCNYHFKGRWDPQRVAGPNATRAELIAAARVHIAERKARVDGDLQCFRAIVGHGERGASAR